MHMEINYNRDFGQNWNHSVMLDSQAHDNWPEVHRWCREQFGKENYTWSGSRFYFKESLDAVMFSLKWGLQ